VNPKVAGLFTARRDAIHYYYYAAVLGSPPPKDNARSLDRGITHCYYNLRNENFGNLLCWENGDDGSRYERRLSCYPRTSKLSSSISLISFCCQYILNTAYFDAHGAINHPSNRLIRQDRDTVAGINFSR